MIFRSKSGLKLGAVAFAAFATLAAPLPAAADFEAGMIAAHNGDHETSMNEWLPLARDGHAKAQYAVGSLFAEGLGTRQDFRKAVEWWRKAAELDHAGAQYNIAVMYMNGMGVKQDSDEAIRWLNSAAKQGNTDAHVQLSRAYRVGAGVEQDPVLSYMWLEIAHLSGRISVARSLEPMAAKLSSAQVADAKARTQSWVRANETQNSR